MAYKKPGKVKLVSSPYRPRNDEPRTIFKAVDFKELDKSKEDETEPFTFDDYYEMITNTKRFTVTPPPVNATRIYTTKKYIRVYIVKYDGSIYEINDNGDFEKYSTTMLPNTYFKVILNWTNDGITPEHIIEENKREVERGAQQLPRGGGLREKFILYFNDLFAIKTSKFLGYKHISSVTGKYGSGHDPNANISSGDNYDKFNNNSITVKAPDSKNIRS